MRKCPKTAMKCYRGPIFSNILFLVRKIETESSNFDKAKRHFESCKPFWNCFRSFQTLQNKFLLFSVLWGVTNETENQWCPRIVSTCPLNFSWIHKTATGVRDFKVQCPDGLTRKWNHPNTGIECVWTESSFSAHGGDLARGISVSKINQTHQRNNPIWLWHWQTECIFLVFVSYWTLPVWRN